LLRLLQIDSAGAPNRLHFGAVWRFDGHTAATVGIDLAQQMAIGGANVATIHIATRISTDSRGSGFCGIRTDVSAPKHPARWYRSGFASRHGLRAVDWERDRR
jgi:hypothetical protein